RFCDKQNARRTVAALRGPQIRKCGLQRIQLTALSKTFNRSDLVPLKLAGQQQARKGGLAIEQYCAGAAFTHFTTVLRADKTKVLTQHLEQSPGAVCSDLSFITVDC